MEDGELKKKIQEINPICQLIVVTKTFGIEKIEPIIKTGHKHFGENKVQEALEKWTEAKDKNKDIFKHTKQGTLEEFFV